MRDPTEHLGTLDHDLARAERIVDAGAHVLAIEDLVRLLRPAAAAGVDAADVAVTARAGTTSQPSTSALEHTPQDTGPSLQATGELRPRTVLGGRPASAPALRSRAGRAQSAAIGAVQQVVGGDIVMVIG